MVFLCTTSRKIGGAEPPQSEKWEGLSPPAPQASVTVMTCYCSVIVYFASRYLARNFEMKFPFACLAC